MSAGCWHVGLRVSQRSGGSGVEVLGLLGLIEYCSGLRVRT